MCVVVVVGKMRAHAQTSEVLAPSGVTGSCMSYLS